MKIGKHKGIRAKLRNDLGYFFETMSVDGFNLFLFDDCERGHDGDAYFQIHPDDWNDELIGRCWFVDLDDITFCKKVLL